MLVASHSVGKITKVSKSTSYAIGNMDGIRSSSLRKLAESVVDNL